MRQVLQVAAGLARQDLLQALLLGPVGGVAQPLHHKVEVELRVQPLLDRAEAALRPGGAPVTIRALWIALADRAGRSDGADLRATAALAGMAMGLHPS